MEYYSQFEPVLVSSFSMKRRETRNNGGKLNTRQKRKYHLSVRAHSVVETVWNIHQVHIIIMQTDFSPERVRGQQYIYVLKMAEQAKHAAELRVVCFQNWTWRKS